MNSSWLHNIRIVLENPVPFPMWCLLGQVWFRKTPILLQNHQIITTVQFLAGPEVTPKNVTVGDTGSDWVLIGWEDFKFCLRQLSYYYMRFVPLYSKGVNNTIYVEVPTTCVNRSFVTGMTDFNSKTCPELFTLESCTNYSVTIEAAIYDNKYLSQPSQSVTFDTIPRKSLFFG